MLAVFISANLLSVINSIKGEEIGKYDLPSADIRIRSIQEQEDGVFQISGELEAVLRVEDLYEGISFVSYTVDADGLVWAYYYPVEEIPQQEGVDPEYSRYETGDYREWDLVWDSQGRVVSMSRCIRICPEEEATVTLSFTNGKGDCYSCRQTMAPVIMEQQEPEESIQELPREEEEQDERYDQETEDVQSEAELSELEEEWETETEDPEIFSPEESLPEAESAAAEDLISEEELLMEEMESEPAADPELTAESGSAAESEMEEDFVPEPESEAESADETESETAPEPEPESESEPLPDPVPEPEPETEPEPVSEPEPEMEPEPEFLPEQVSEPEPEPEPAPAPLPEEPVVEPEIKQQDEPQELLEEAETQPQMPVTQSYEAPVYYYPQYSAVPAPSYRNTYTPPAVSYSTAGSFNASGTGEQIPGTENTDGYNQDGDPAEDDKQEGMESGETEIPTREAEKEEETSREKINTEGSAYDISEIEDLIGQCLQEVPDLVIYENNADTIDLETVKVLTARNTETFELEKEADYTVKLTGLSEELKTYKYVIDKSVFEEEGSYRVFLFSEDASGNSNSSEGKDTPIWFTVDVSSPLILSCEDTIEQQERSVREVRVKDNTGLSAVDIYLGDRKMEYETEGETYRFQVPEEIEQADVKVVARDEAGNTYERILPGYVTAGKPKMRPANKAPVRMIAAAAAAAAIAMILIRKKKKRRN